MVTGRKYKANREDFGTIRERSSGRFQASYLAPDGNRYNAPMTYTTRTDARSWLAGVRTDIERGKWKSPAATKAEVFAAYAATWVAQRASAKGQPLRPKTATEYSRQLARGLAEFANDNLGDITPARVRAWHAARAKVAPTAAGAEARLLRAILNTALEDGIVEKNPVPAKLTKSSAGKTFRAPTLDEMAVLVEAIGDRYRLGILIAAYGGMRLSEWRALRRKDLTLVNGRYVVSVTRQAQHVTGSGWIVGPPKSARGVRVVALPAFLTPDVDAHLTARVGSFPEALVFAPLGRSEFVHDSDFNLAWNKARDAAGVRGEVREHDLRGFSGSHLLHTAGANVYELRDFLGHSSIRVAEDHYVRGVADRSAELADLMPQLPTPKPKNVTEIAKSI